MFDEFCYCNPEPGNNQDTFDIVIPAGIRNRQQLFEQYMNAGSFPEYFGLNWDALEECLRDLSWLKPFRIRILHEDLPLKEDLSGLKTYLDVLTSSMAYWKNCCVDSDSGVAGHELSVYFPSRIRSQIEST